MIRIRLVQRPPSSLEGWKVNEKRNKNIHVAGSLGEQLEQQYKAGCIEALIASLSVLPCDANISIRKDANAAPSSRGEITAYTPEAEVIISSFVNRLRERLSQYAREHPRASLVMTCEQTMRLRPRR